VLGIELPAKPARVGVEGARPAEGLKAPHVLQELLLAEDALGLGGEVAQQLELLV
jgi:hypothetical protein